MNLRSSVLKIDTAVFILVRYTFLKLEAEENLDFLTFCPLPSALCLTEAALH